MADMSSTPQPRRPTLGFLSQIAGIVGAIACVLLIIGLWWGQGWITDRIEEFTASAQRAVTRATDVADTAVSQFGALSDEVGAISTGADQIASDPAATSQALGALTARLQPVATRYSATRDTYVVLRERVHATLDTVQRMVRFVPDVSVPPVLPSALGTIDEHIAAMDAALTGLMEPAVAAAGVSTTANALAGAATTLAGAITRAEADAVQIQAGLTDLGQQIGSLSASIGSAVGTLSIVLTIVLAWGFVLQCALWVLGRRWRAA